MKKRPGIQKISLVTGCILIVCSLILLASWQFSISGAAKKSSDYVETIRTLIPESEPAVPEEKSNNTMPVLSVDGIDFMGIMEFPEYDSAFPVCGDWNGKLLYPCRYSGSIYDGSMKIGATTQKGQLDFYREISVGDVVYFTDLTGNRYSYEIADILYRKHADNEMLDNDESDLTLFIKNLYAFEYVIIHCKTMA